MLNWSNTGYKLTLGVGSLILAAMLSELWQNILPAWAGVGIALLPLVLFVFVHPNELPARAVWVAHVLAATWYLVLAVSLTVLIAVSKPLPRGWPVGLLFLVMGAIPCGTVLYRVARGRYQSPAASENGNAEQSMHLTGHVMCGCSWRNGSRRVSRLLNLVFGYKRGMPENVRAETIILLSKRKIALLIFGSIAFVGASIGLWYIADSQPRSELLYVKGVALAGISFFGLCGIYGCIKLFDGRPGLLIDKEGIVDNSSAVSAGRIPWSEITDLKISQIAGQRILTIEVSDAEKYIAGCNLLKRMLNSANTKLLGSPVNISANSLQMSFDELVLVMSKAIEAYKEPADEFAPADQLRS